MSIISWLKNHNPWRLPTPYEFNVRMLEETGLLLAEAEERCEFHKAQRDKFAARVTRLTEEFKTLPSVEKNDPTAMVKRKKYNEKLLREARLHLQGEMIQLEHYLYRVQELRTRIKRLKTQIEEDLAQYSKATKEESKAESVPQEQSKPVATVTQLVKA
jgi:hypothetical protein